MNDYRLELAKSILPKVITLNVKEGSINREYMCGLGIHEGFDVMRSGQSGKVVLDWEN